MNRNILFAGGAALVGYYLYKQMSVATVAPTPNPNPTPQPVPYANTLARVKAAIPSAMMAGVASPDGWNVYAAQAISGYTPPTPEQMFPNATDAHAPVSFSTWWAAITPFLPQGLTGFPGYAYLSGMQGVGYVI